MRSASFEAVSVPRVRRWPRLGLGGHLALGLAAVAAVVVAGQVIVRRTTQTAVEAVRNMQAHDEPLAIRSDVVIERLSAYDRTVVGYLESDEPTPPETLIDAEAALDGAVRAYFAAAGTPPSAQTALIEHIASHVTLGRRLAEQAGRRREWQARRRALLDADSRRIVQAGGAGLAVNGSEVIARRSLAELDTAINALRAAPDTGRDAVHAEKQLRAVLLAHQAEFLRSPGPAWLELVQDDFHAAVVMRLRIEHFDTASGAARRAFLADGADLLASAQTTLQHPARADLASSAQRAADAAAAAAHTLVVNGAIVLGVVLLVSIVLGLRILLPVRRLTAATRQLTSGRR
ncbi:MAG: hypothetical protein ACRETB_03005, partial [Steroidobacteraceae bacterium]